MTRKLLAPMFFAATMLALATSVHAVDGVIDINQAKVNAAGGFPYTISASGSYRLTGNLTGVPANTNAITVTSNNVSIDLNGFSIAGPGSGTTGNGINAASVNQIEVGNGTVTGFFIGVWVGSNSIVRNVRAVSNAYGIEGGGGGAANSLIQGCTASSNSSYGILCQASGCVISGNAANSNTGSYGIRCSGSGCGIFGNTVNHNTGFGIACGLVGCAISGNTVANNTSDGIHISGTNSLIVRNTMQGNGGYGLNASDATSGYGENVMSNNTSGNFLNGTSMKDNVCSGVVC
jgi:parallel beta-helix repeat protein